MPDHLIDGTSSVVETVLEKSVINSSVGFLKENYVTFEEIKMDIGGVGSMIFRPF